MRWTTTTHSRNGAAIGDSASFTEDLGLRIELNAQTVELADGTVARLSLAWVGGAMEGLANSQDSGLVGTVLTLEQGTEARRFLFPSSLVNDVETARRTLADLVEASSIATQGWSPGELSLTEEVPPEFTSDICFNGTPGQIAALGVCGEPYCGCMTDELNNATLSNALCTVTLAGAVASCAALTGGLAWTSCILAAMSTPGCVVPASFLSGLGSCRDTANTCYCDRSLQFPQYGWLCNFANDRKVYAHVSGLYSGERVEVVGTCGVGLGDPPNQYGYKTFEGPGATQLILQCNRTHAFKLEILPVTSPGVAVSQRRTCIAPINPEPFGPASAIPDQGATFDFDCSCTDAAQCPGKDVEASVSGLQNIPVGFRNVAIEAVLEVNNTGVTQRFMGTASTDTDSAHLYFQDAATGTRLKTYPGTTFLGYLPRLLPTGCQVLPQFAVGQTLPADSPGDLHLLDVQCEDVVCEEGDCLRQAVVAVSGDTVALRAGGVRVSAQIGNQFVSQTANQAGDLNFGTYEVGTQYSGLAVENPSVAIGADSSVCIVTGPKSGQVADSDPFVLGRVECQRIKDSSPRLPRNKSPRPRPPAGAKDPFRGLDGECFLYCPGGGVTISSYGECDDPCAVCGQNSDGSCLTPCLCDEIDVVRPGCDWVCPGGGGPGSVYRTVPFLSTWLGGGTANPSGSSGLLIDDELVVGGYAQSDEGLQGFVLAIDGEYRSHVEAGGHTSAALDMTRIDTSSLTEGEHLAQVIALDNHPEAPMPAVAEFAFTVDHVAPCDNDHTGPTAEITTPQNGQLFAPGWIDFAATASDPNGVERVRFWVDGRERGAPTTPPYETAWFASPGTYDLEARAIDTCGNWTRLFATVNVYDACNGMPLPEVEITNLEDGAWLDPEVYTVHADVTDHSGTGIDRVEFTVGTFETQIDTAAPWSSNGHYLLTEGDVPIEVRAYDHCGRASIERITVHVRESASACEVDDGPPTAYFTNPLQGASITEGDIAVTTFVQDDLNLLAGTLEIDGVLPPGNTVLSPLPSAYHWTWAATPGVHTLRLSATDVCWKTTRTQITVTVEPDPLRVPQPPVILPALLRVLDGPISPPGPPLDQDSEIDFGTFFGSGLSTNRTVRVFSLLNDGGQPLEVTAIDFSGPGFELAEPVSLPFFIPGLRGEAIFRVQPTGVGVGPVTETMNVQTSRGPHTVLLKVLIDPNEGAGYANHFQDDFETGDLSAWTGVVGTAAAATAKAADQGSYGLGVDFTGNPPASFVFKPFGSLKAAFRTKFRFRPDGLDLPESQPLNLALTVNAGPSEGWVQVRRVGSTFQVRGLARLDSGANASTPWLAVPSGYQSLDFAWWASDEAGKNNGGIRLVTGDWSVGEATGLDNDEQRVERFRFGAPLGAVAAIEGSIAFDDVHLWY